MNIHEKINYLIWLIGTPDTVPIFKDIQSHIKQQEAINKNNTLLADEQIQDLKKENERLNKN